MIDNASPTDTHKEIRDQQIRVPWSIVLPIWKNPYDSILNQIKLLEPRSVKYESSTNVLKDILYISYHIYKHTIPRYNDV